jgi:hypothetical protein
MVFAQNAQQTSISTRTTSAVPFHQHAGFLMWLLNSAPNVIQDMTYLMVLVLLPWSTLHWMLVARDGLLGFVLNALSDGSWTRPANASKLIAAV